MLIKKQIEEIDKEARIKADELVWRYTTVMDGAINRISEFIDNYGRIRGELTEQAVLQEVLKEIETRQNRYKKSKGQKTWTYPLEKLRLNLLSKLKQKGEEKK